MKIILQDGGDDAILQLRAAQACLHHMEQDPEWKGPSFGCGFDNGSFYWVRVNKSSVSVRRCESGGAE